MLSAVVPPAAKYCGSCYETKPLTDFADNGAGEYCRYAPLSESQTGCQLELTCPDRVLGSTIH